MSDSAPVIARFARPTADRRTRIAALSDLHLSTDGHGTWRVSHQTEERLAAAVESLDERTKDAVFFNGDLVQSGTRAEFDAFDRVADRLDAPLFAVPGNHDLVDLGESSREKLGLAEFEDRYTPGEVPYRKRVGGVDLVGLSSNTSTHESLAGSYRGRLDDSTLDWLGETCREVENPIVGVHHTLEPVRERYRRDQQRLPVRNGGSPDFENSDALVDVLSKHDVPLVMSGHIHVPTVARAGSVREFSLPPLGPFPCGYSMVEIDQTGTTVTYHAIGEADTRIEALGHGCEQDRVLLAAAQLTDVPLVDENR